jgi:hypothetical protein
MKKQKKSAPGFWVILNKGTSTCSLTNRKLKKGERVFFIPSQGFVGEKEYLKIKNLHTRKE